MSKNICVLTGARDSGMCKIYGYLRENGVNITGFHERCDLIDDSEAVLSEGDSIITEKDIENKVIMLTTKQTEALAEKARKKDLAVVQLIVQSPKYSLGRIVNMLPIYGNEDEAEVSEYIRKIAGKPDTYIINVDRNTDSTCKYVLDMVKNIIYEDDINKAFQTYIKKEFETYKTNMTSSDTTRGAYAVFEKSLEVSQVKALAEKLPKITDDGVKAEALEYEKKHGDLMIKMAARYGNCLISADVGHIEKKAKNMLKEVLQGKTEL